MVKGESTRNPSDDNPILARDQHGAEYQIEVLEQHGLVVIRDAGMIRIMAPPAVVELVLQLLSTLGGRLIPPAGPGPISGSF